MTSEQLKTGLETKIITPESLTSEQVQNIVTFLTKWCQATMLNEQEVLSDIFDNIRPNQGYVLTQLEFAWGEVKSLSRAVYSTNMGKLFMLDKDNHLRVRQRDPRRDEVAWYQAKIFPCRMTSPIIKPAPRGGGKLSFSPHDIQTRKAVQCTLGPIMDAPVRTLDIAYRTNDQPPGWKIAHKVSCKNTPLGQLVGSQIS